MIREVKANPFIPYAFQKDHSGMQGTEYIDNPEDLRDVKFAWLKALDLAVMSAELLNDGFNVTKQLANRIIEPFMWHKVLISGTEWENFFNLRCPQYKIHQGTYKSRKEALKYALSNGELKHWTILDWLIVNEGQADIHMMFLAESIYDAINESTPVNLKEGEWHIPYGDLIDFTSKEYSEAVDDNTDLTWQDYAIRIGIARCARLSYQTLGDNPVIDYKKDLELYEVLSKSGHWSPFEHVAKVMTTQEYELNVKGELKWTGGQYDKPLPVDNAQGWCRNFRGFIQQRALID
jgi:hypothetical protein